MAGNAKFTERLNDEMFSRHMRQYDLHELIKPISEEYGTKISKSDLSTYCSGVSAPRAEKLFVLAKALGVSEAWLMGYNTDKNPTGAAAKPSVEDEEQIQKEQKLLESYRKLTDKEQQLALRYINALLVVRKGNKLIASIQETDDE
jgi:transcriptional regulator with XRE-family HTH domain